MPASLPSRGEIWQVDLGIAGKIRPAVIVNGPLSESDYVLFTVVPHTTQENRSAYAVTLRVPQLKEGRFNVQGIASLPRSRFVRKICALDANQMEAIEAGLRRWLCL